MSQRAVSRTVSRRQFLIRSGAAVGTAAATVLPVLGQKRPSPTDLVPLGSGGLKICRLGFGTGTNGGQVQRELGQQRFSHLIRYAYDQGITYIDTADAYKTHEMVREAIRGLPRERLWIQTKMPWETPDNSRHPLQTLDRYRKELGVEYIDSLLIHCTTRPTWPDDLARMMDAFSEAQQKGLIRMKGVSCHGLPALRRATAVDWVDVQLARINPQGRHVDGMSGEWAETGDVPAAMAEIRAIHGKGRGVIGMKIIGNGDFTRPEDREKSVRYALNCGCVDSIVIGFSNPAEIDEILRLMTDALAA